MQGVADAAGPAGAVVGPASWLGDGLTESVGSGEEVPVSLGELVSVDVSLGVSVGLALSVGELAGDAAVAGVVAAVGWHEAAAADLDRDGAKEWVAEPSGTGAEWPVGGLLWLVDCAPELLGEMKFEAVIAA